MRTEGVEFGTMLDVKADAAALNCLGKGLHWFIADVPGYRLLHMNVHLVVHPGNQLTGGICIAIQ